jgi:predicted nucleotidyltransferase component of viral defense system
MMLDTATHKNILIRILKDIYTNSAIGPILGFKGGTAAFLFYGLNRFSVDLDFDLLDSSKKQQVLEELKKILEEYGTIKDSSKKFIVSYNEKAHNIKVDINPKDFGSQYEIKSYLGISMKVMVKEDMAAHKMVAMLEREANRDIFDTYYFLKNNWPINDRIIENRTGLLMHQFLKKCIKELESLSDQHILNGLGELLDAKQKIWVKKSLRSETIFLLKLKLENYPIPPRAFLYSYKQGNNMYDPSGLGARSYKEYQTGGIYNKPMSPATAIIRFEGQTSDAFLDMFLQAMKEKNLDEKRSNLIGDKKGQALELQTYLNEKDINKIIAKLNKQFSE